LKGYLFRLPDLADETLVLGKLWEFLKRHLVEEVPDEMSSCLDCGAVQCRDEQYETCPNRLAREATPRVVRGHRPDWTDGDAQS
jgi:hypothetical protein